MTKCWRRRGGDGKKRKIKGSKGGSGGDVLEPVLNARLLSLRVVQVACGGSHTLVTTLDNRASKKKSAQVGKAPGASTKASARAADERRGSIVQHRGMLQALAQKAGRRRSSSRSKRRGGRTQRTAMRKSELMKQWLASLQQAEMASNTAYADTADAVEREEEEEEEAAVAVAAAAEVIRRRKFAAIEFPPPDVYLQLSLRDFVQDIFDGIDPSNDGRILTEKISLSIRHNARLRTMLRSRQEVAALGELEEEDEDEPQMDGSRPSSLEVSLNRIDADGDGFLTVTELLTFARQRQAVVEEARRRRHQRAIAREIEDSTRREQEAREAEEAGADAAEAATAQVAAGLPATDETGLRWSTKGYRRQQQKDEALGGYPVLSAEIVRLNAEQRRLDWDRSRRLRRQEMRRRGNKTMLEKKGPYHQQVIMSDRRRAKDKLRRLFEESYVKTLARRGRMAQQGSVGQQRGWGKEA